MKETERIWWSIRKDGVEYIVTLPPCPVHSREEWAFAAHGPMVPFPFEILGAASPDDVEWAEEQVALWLETEERAQEDRARAEHERIEQ